MIDIHDFGREFPDIGYHRSRGKKKRRRKVQGSSASQQIHIVAGRFQWNLIVAKAKSANPCRILSLQT
jgi:hypothetical protein